MVKEFRTFLRLIKNLALLPSINENVNTLRKQLDDCVGALLLDGSVSLPRTPGTETDSAKRKGAQSEEYATITAAADHAPVTETGLRAYDSWASGRIVGTPSAPTSLVATSAPYDAAGEIIQAMQSFEVQIATKLIEALNRLAVPGAIVEFGVFEGEWLERLVNMERAGQVRRDVYGFDSFEGLPSPGSSDLDCWSAGDYAASYEHVTARLKCKERSNVHLIRGWFKDTLVTSPAAEISAVAYARVDCDLFESASDCLEFLTKRLSNGAVLVFDDWTWDLSNGETKAFAKWADKNPNLQFEFVFYGHNGHFYLRVTRTKH